MHSFLRSLIATLLFAVIYLTSGPASALAQFVCQPSGSPIVTTGTLTVADPTQAGRIVRDGLPSTCTGKSNALQNSTAVRAKSYNFTAPVTGCATVDFNHLGCGGNTTEVVAYSMYNPASPATGVIGDPGFSSTGTGSFSFPVTGGVPFTMVVHEIAPNSGCASFSFTISYSTSCRTAGYDRTNDGIADPTVFRPSTGDWYALNSAGGISLENFGMTGDIVTPGDYTGDGQTDVSIYRPSTSTWYYGNNHTNPGQNFTAIQWGTTNDVSVPGDYDRDGKTDIAIWRPGDGTWYILRSTTGTLQTQVWGANGDVPALGDFDGDRVNDFGLARPNDPAFGGNTGWYVLESNFNFGFFLRTQWGISTDKIVPADYDGNGKTDIAVWRPSDGTWYVIKSGVTVNPTFAVQWGANGDIPQPADYDGDKKADFAVVRQGATPNQWFILRSSDSTLGSPAWGAAGDVPATTAYRIP